MDHKEAYTQEREQQLDAWMAEIDRLGENAHRIEGEAKIEHLQVVDRLRAQQEIARHKLANLQKADDEAWQDQKSAVDIAWHNLGSAIKSAADIHE